MRLEKVGSILVLLFVLSIVSAQTVNTPSTKNYLSATDSANIILRGVNYDPSPAEPGKYVDIFVAAQNLGNKDLSRSWFKLDEEYPFSFDLEKDSIKEIDLIPAGREELLEFRLRVDDQAIEGDYDMDVILCGDSECNKELRKSPITIKVRTGGKPKLEIGLEDSSVLLPNVLGEITISAVNRGKLGIKFLTVEILDSEDYEIISPSRVYIGELNSDDFETEDFQIYINSNSDINIPVKVEYSDENFKDYAGVENIELKVFNKEQAEKMGLVSTSNFGKYSIITIIIFLLLIFLYKRRKRKNET